MPGRADRLGNAQWGDPHKHSPGAPERRHMWVGHLNEDVEVSTATAHGAGEGRARSGGGGGGEGGGAGSLVCGPAGEEGLLCPQAGGQ